MENLQKIAVLIDADNTQIDKLENVIREISAYGRIIVKRAFGNWKKDNLKNWENELNRLAIKPVQQFDYVRGKNATDMALVIDAMELLHTNIYDGFAIVASDSDYTPIAIKLREFGINLIGVGVKDTPEAFRNACDVFIYLENLKLNKPEPDPKKPTAKETADSKLDAAVIHELLKIAHNKWQDDEGYTNVSAAGAYIARTMPDFDLRSYGFEKLPDLIKAYPKKYEIKKYQGKGTVNIVAYKCL
jgi:uncharacterized protein (TIGR00288 family)